MRVSRGQCQLVDAVAVECLPSRVVGYMGCTSSTALLGEASGPFGPGVLLFLAIPGVVAGCARSRAEQGHASEPSAVPVASAAPRVSAAPPIAPRAAPLPERVPVTPEAQTACRGICERSKQLKCKRSDECLPNCYGTASLTPCSKEIGPLFACMLREPVEHWECGEDGIGAIRDGYCDKEQREAVACMEKKMTQ